MNKDLVAMLYGVVTTGTGRSAAVPGHEAAGKTGTTQDYHDAWFVGFTADYVTSVWVGNDDSAAMKGVTGGTLPASIWHAVMASAEEGRKSTPLDKSPSTSAPVEDTTEYDTGLTEAPATTSSDDESGGASSASAEPHQQIPPGERRNFFDWLFGSRNKTPPPPPPPPQSGDNNGDNDSN